MATKVIHIRDSKNHPDYIYIGRSRPRSAGYFGNPIQKGKVCPLCKDIHRTAGETLPCFKQMFMTRLATDKEYNQKVHDLEGSILYCFCCPKDGFNGRLLCHGQIIAGYLDQIPPENVGLTDE